MKPVPASTPVAFAVTPARLGVLAALALTAGCSTTGDGLLSGDKIDYRTATVRTQPLEVPPDLTQLAREGRYQPQRGVISAAAVGAAAAATPTAAASAPAAVALDSLGAMRVERDGQQRWLVVPQTPEQLWPKLKAFWEERGFTLTQADAQAGVMETNWSENRAKIPNDAIRNVVGRLMGRLYDSGERDSFRTRIERSAAGSEVYVTHRGVQEIYTDERKEGTTWRARPTDPQLEAEFLSRLMVALGGAAEPARAAVAAAAPASAATAAGAVASAPQASALTLAEPFDRAWRRVGVALDRSGFTVEDRDRTAGLYFVRYVDPKSAGMEEPGFWAKLFGNPVNPLAALRYRVALKTTDGKTVVSVQNSAGTPETGENARNIIGRLTQELR
ncbi:MAG: outer membrane protein assembly factor BamC [Rubrivivax sp.]|nr:outer membrane protein assembly factor BamC [Rubrivivax sp.]